jgi:undecaprenyl-diphosphatase
MLASLKSLDTWLFLFINSHHVPIFDHFFLVVTSLGSGWVIAPIILFFILKKIPAPRRISIIVFSLIVMIASGVVNSRLKKAFRTPRPAAIFAQEHDAASDAVCRARNISARTMHIVGERLMENSFPSGHTNTVFSAAMLMVLCFGWRWWPAFIVAGLVGYSRVYLGAHFPSDVAGGAVLGVAIVWIGFMCYIQFDIKRRLFHDQ